MIRLGVNVDHIATLRQARLTHYPSPLQAALIAQSSGADNITCHLREDRRHIQDTDVEQLAQALSIPLNFEMASTKEMVEVACRIKPHCVTLVPEKRQELTTEGGLPESELQSLKSHIQTIKERSKAHLILFVEPDVKIIEASKEIGADGVELHTGSFCLELEKIRSKRQGLELCAEFNKACLRAADLKMNVHIGHGINYQNAMWMQCLDHVEEANIGHAIVSQALFCGFSEAVRGMKSLLNDSAFRP